MSSPISGASSTVERAGRRVSLLEDLGHKLEPGARVLDLGCGNGTWVNSFLTLGFDAHGADFVFKEGPLVEKLVAEDRIRIITPVPYRLPFDDDSFDLVISDQVMEHVKEYGTFVSEIHRILRPGGLSLHTFPPRYTPLEAHVRVPLATLIQSYPWLLLWAALRFRPEHQQGLPARAVAARNAEYLQTRTNYLTTGEIRRAVEATFPVCQFIELEALKHTSKRRLYPLLRRIPFSGALLSNCLSRAILFQKPR